MMHVASRTTRSPVSKLCANNVTHYLSRNYPCSNFPTLIEIERKFLCSPSMMNYCNKNSISVKDMKMIDTYYDTPSYDLTKLDMWLRSRNKELELKWPQECDDMKNIEVSGTDFYLESTDLIKIAEVIQQKLYISLQPVTNDIKYSWLSTQNIKPFGTINTHRKRHHIIIPLTHKTSQSVFIDIDHVTYYPPTSQEINGYKVDHHHHHHHHHHHSGDNSKISTNIDDTTNDTKYQYIIGEIEFCNNSHLYSMNRRELEERMKQVFDILHINTSQHVRGKVLEYLYRFAPNHYQALQDCGQLLSKGIK